MTPTIDDIRAAALRLAGLAVETPLLSAPLLDAELGGRLLVKAESLQLTGSFKIRGAGNRIALIPDAARPCGVIAYSSGNHAQGVAAAAARAGMQATIVMPADAPLVKRESTAAWGARVVTYDRFGPMTREQITAGLQAESGATLVKPFDDPAIIAGQGTAGLEIARQCERLGLVPDAAVVPVSGGGLIAGVGIALRHAFPQITLHGAEPEGYDDTARSLAAGEPVSIAPGPTLQDSLTVTRPGDLTFPINRAQLAGVAVIPDDAALAAMAVLFRHFRLVVEPGGASALAAVLTGRVPIRGRTVVVVASGGNVDPAVFGRCLSV